MDTSAMTAGAAKAEGSLAKVGRAAMTMGSVIGVAAVAAGAIATKMALDYDDAFTKIAAVSNASAKDIEKWKGQVLDLAGKTAQAPKELADALFFLASAGLKTSQIMPVLEASAKASAAGLGETADIAKLTANTLNAYAGSGLKAAKVTDILVAAVREGSADTDEFGTAIGRILPIASTAGIGFDSVAASLAALSNVGLDVNEGVTAMRGLLQALVAPTAAAAGAMQGIGLSAQDLLDSLQQNGLVATIRMLDDAVKKNTTSGADYMGMLRTIVPNVRALTGMLGLTSQQAERVDSVFQRVKDSTGSLDEAFKTTAESAGFKFRQALADLEVVAIRLGDLILPVLAAIVDFLMKNVGPAWDATVGWLKKVWDAVGPVVTILGGALLDAATKVWHTFEDNVLPSLKKLWEAIKPLLPILGVLASAILLIALEVLPVLFKVMTAWIVVLAVVVDFIRTKVVGPVVGFFQDLVDWFREHLGGIKDAWSDVWGAIRGTVAAVVGPIVAFIDRINDAIRTLVGWAITALHALEALNPFSGGTPGKGPSLGDAQFRGPSFQHGGVVQHTGPALVHAGETIIPAGGGAGGITITINGDVTGEEIVRKVRDGLLKLGARNGTTGL